jgi:hypothetical protein
MSGLDNIIEGIEEEPCEVTHPDYHPNAERLVGRRPLIETENINDCYYSDTGSIIGLTDDDYKTDCLTLSRSCSPSYFNDFCDKSGCSEPCIVSHVGNVSYWVPETPEEWLEYHLAVKELVKMGLGGATFGGVYAYIEDDEIKTVDAAGAEADPSIIPVESLVIGRFGRAMTVQVQVVPMQFPIMFYIDGLHCNDIYVINGTTYKHYTGREIYEREIKRHDRRNWMNTIVQEDECSVNMTNLGQRLCPTQRCNGKRVSYERGGVKDNILTERVQSLKNEDSISKMCFPPYTHQNTDPGRNKREASGCVSWGYCMIVCARKTCDKDSNEAIEDVNKLSKAVEEQFREQESVMMEEKAQIDSLDRSLHLLNAELNAFEDEIQNAMMQITKNANDVYLFNIEQGKEIREIRNQVIFNSILIEAIRKHDKIDETVFYSTCDDLFGHGKCIYLGHGCYRELNYTVPEPPSFTFDPELPITLPTLEPITFPPVSLPQFEEISDDGWEVAKVAGTSVLIVFVVTVIVLIAIMCCCYCQCCSLGGRMKRGPGPSAI